MYYGWRIVGASFSVLFVIVGVVYYSFPVFYAPLIQEFGWSRAAVTAGFAISIALIGPVFGVSAGFLIDRWGTKRILLAGLLCAGAAFVGFRYMQSLTAYYAFYFLQTVGYVSAGPVPNQVLISHWFRRMRGRAMGIAYVGIGVGGAIAPVGAQFLIGRFGWRAAMLAIAGMVLALLIPLVLLVVKNRPSDMALSPDGDPQTAPPGAPEPAPAASPAGLKEALRTRAFWFILLGSLLSIGAVGGVIQHLVLFLRDRRFSAEDAAQVASLLLVASIAGRLVMGWLADRFPKKYVMLAACLMVALAIPVLLFAHVPGAVYLFAFVFGFGMGADYMLIPLLTAECFGLAALGRLMGVILTTDALAQAVTPVIVGRMYDVQGTYLWGFALLALLAGAGAFAISRVSVSHP